MSDFAQTLKTPGFIILLLPNANDNIVQMHALTK